MCPVNGAERAAWQALVSGHRAAARASAAVSRPVAPVASLERAVGLRLLARGRDERDAAERERENLAFHLRMKLLRSRLGR